MKKRMVALAMCLLMAFTSIPYGGVAQLLEMEASAATVRVESLDPLSTLTSGRLKMTAGTEETFKVMVQPSSATNKKLKWTSSASSVVALSEETVSSSGIASVTLSALKEGTSKITYSTTDGSDISASFTVEVLPLVESLKLNQYVKSITRSSEGEKLVATVSPSDAGNQNLKWVSSDEKICKVDRDGVLYPVAEGECYISVATTDGSDIVKTCRLVVGKKAQSVSLSKSSYTLENGRAVALYATVTTTDGSKHDAVTWKSSSTKVATVSSEGVVTAKYPGTATITATVADGTEKYASCKITVTQKITKITLEESVNVGVGKTLTLNAAISPSYATDKKLTWSSDNTSVATVSTSGVVTAKKVGTATITCKNSDGSAYDTCKVNVVILATGITVSSSMEELWKGEELVLSATVTPDEATDKSVTWSSTNKSVATVSSDGTVTAVAGGSCKIKAENSAGQSDYCELTVLEAATGVRLEEFEKIMYVSQISEIKAEVLPLTATNREVTFSSSDEDVVTVEADGTLKAIKTGTATITAKSVDGSFKDTCIITVNKKINVTGVSLDEKEITVKVGKTFQLLGTVSPANASDKRLKWSTSSSSVATVSSTGIVKGIKAGSAVITATSYDGNYYASCKVIVQKAVTGVKLSASTAKIAVGKSKTLTCTVLPSDASNKSVTWKSSDTSVATVSKGIVTAKKAGSAVITVTTKDGSFKAACNVTVYVPVKGVEISVSTLKVPKGETRVVTAVVKPSNATDKSVTWSSSNTGVAKVSSTGKITGVSKGTAKITCRTSNGSYKASCEVTVIQLAEKVKLDATYVSLQAGNYKTLTAVLSPSSASNKTVKWKSSNKKIAIVSSKGVVKAVGPGTATITAISGDGNAETTCKIKVSQPATGIKLNKKEGVIRIGSKSTLKATVLPSNASNKDVTWISSNKEVATVSSSGVVKGVSRGSVKITAKTADGKHSATCKVTVIKGVTGVKLDKVSITMNVGKSTTITPTVSPKDATIKTVKWYSDNNDVATVDKNGKVVAKGPGYATITAKTTDGSFKAKATVLVIRPVTGVKLNYKASYLGVGKTLTLKAEISPKDASVKSVTWKSSDTKVATVSSKGVVKGISKGTVTITCTTKNGKKVATCKIQVVKRVTKVTLSHSKEILYFGDKLKLKATVYPTDATVKTYSFISSNTKVAKVSSSGVVTPINVGTCKIAVVTKDGSHKDICTVTVKKAPEKLVLGAVSTTLKAGQSKTIKYAVYPADATNRKATFKSSNTGVAKVSSSGKITGVSKGKATITVSTENGIKKYFKVTVKQQVTGVEVDSTATVYTGKTLKLYASALPKDAENKKLTFSSSDTSVVKVNSKGVITGMRAGKATITVKSAENSKLKATCRVTVKQRVTSISFSEREVFIPRGEELDLKYTVKPSDATNKSVTFKSSDSKTVSVTSDGRIKGIKSGSAKITVTSGENKDIKAICYITVGEPAAGVSLNYKTKDVFVGSKLTLKATVSPSDAYNKTVRWSSDNAEKASVSSKGVVTALASGTATITVTTVDGSHKASCVLNLLQRATSVSLEKKSATVIRGNTLQLQATVLPEDCYDKSYEWTSADETIATVTADGLVTTHAPGVVELTCRSLESGVYAVFTLTVHEPVTEVILGSSELTLYTPLTHALEVTVLPENASDKSLRYESSDESVLKVDENGVITALSRGEAEITVTSKDTGVTDSLTVTVLTGVEEIITDKDAYSLHENTSHTMTISLVPEVVDDPRITLTSSNEEIFTVTEQGVITGLVPGSASLTIASVQNPEVVRVIPVTVTRAVTGITLEETQKLLYAGEDFTLQPVISPADASDKTVLWTSSDTEVLTVDENGTVTALSRGFATVTGTTRDGSFTVSCSLEVVQLPEQVACGSDSVTAYMGRELQLEMTVLPEDTNDKTLTFTSSDESIATVDENGVVTPVSLGSCVITAASVAEGVEKKVTVTVNQLCEGIEINCRIPDLFPGQRLRLIASVLPEDTTDKRISWSSSDESIAVIDEFGVVKTVGAGTVKLTARSLDGSGTEKTVELKVMAYIDAVKLPYTQRSLELGESFSLEATVTPELAYDRSLTYESSDESIVTVDENGVVTGLKTGSAVITATAVDKEHSAQLTVTVIKAATDIRLYRSEFELQAGGRVKVEYDILPEDTTQTEITWSSSDTNVAQVDSRGVITAVSAGTATVTLNVTGTEIRKTVSVTVV